MVAIYGIIYKGYVYIFRPIAELNVDRLERDIDKLNALYRQGYDEARDKIDELKICMSDIPVNLERRQQ